MGGTHTKTTLRHAKTIRCAIVGASGYVGLELMRLLDAHPSARVVLATSDANKGKNVKTVFPAAGVDPHLAFTPHTEAANFKNADVFFLALPHGKSYDIIEKLLAVAPVIDISADFRLSDPADYEKWYGYKHPNPKLLKSAVYAVSELYPAKIAKARLIANPGCYPTSIALAIAPLRKLRDYFGGPVICDSKSGYSGAGRSLKPNLLFCEGHGDFAPYGVINHRHTSEMLSFAAETLGKPVPLTFTPHLIPAPRGILSSIYVPLKKQIELKKVRKTYTDFYRDKPFVVVGPDDVLPTTKMVNGTNLCRINMFIDADSGTLKIFSAIDNLIKGAAGQAIQNMNLVFGLPEATGLPTVPMIP